MRTVAFVTPWPTDDPRAWSGTIAHMIRSLRDHVKLVPVSTADVADSIIDRGLARTIDGVRGKRYLVGHALATSVKRGRALKKRLDAIQPDAVLAVAASQDIACLGGVWPVVQVSDLTFSTAGQLYADFQNLGTLARWQGKELSRRSVQRTTATLAATTWVRDALIRDDHIAPEDIVVAPFGPGVVPPAGTAGEIAAGAVEDSGRHQQLAPEGRGPRGRHPPRAARSGC